MPVSSNLSPRDSQHGSKIRFLQHLYIKFPFTFIRATPFFSRSWSTKRRRLFRLYTNRTPGKKPPCHGTGKTGIISARVEDGAFINIAIYSPIKSARFRARCCTCPRLSSTLLKVIRWRDGNKCLRCVGGRRFKFSPQIKLRRSRGHFSHFFIAEVTALY